MSKCGVVPSATNPEPIRMYVEIYLLVPFWLECQAHPLLSDFRDSFILCLLGLILQCSICSDIEFKLK